MSFAKVHSAQISFLKAHIVDIEVDLSRGLHSFSLVGLANRAVEEAKDRISAAIKNSGFTSPKQKNQKIVVSLAPADIKKEGPHFDLGIAIGYLKAANDISFEESKRLFLGELSLDGEVKKIRGVIALVLEARQKGFTEVYVPKENTREAALIKGILIYGVNTLRELVEHLQRKMIIAPEQKKNEENCLKEVLSESNQDSSVNFSDIQGQETVKRVMEIAAAGRHNILLYGPPGTGKTMLAKAFQHILPPLTYEEILEVTAIHSVASVLTDPFIIVPPMRAPHHTSSASAIIGGGNSMRPGEITLAHRGVLFLDEFPEFDRRVIESLRQPLEEKQLSLSRAKSSALFPADFILIAAMNPCPCGNLGSKEKLCKCSQNSLEMYRKKISDPICDRIDLWIKVDNQKHDLLSTINSNESTLEIKKRVILARNIQKQRFKKINSPTSTNGGMSSLDIKKSIQLSREVKSTLDKIAGGLQLSTRGYYRVIKIARTIADLANENNIEKNHILEAAQYRSRMNQ